MILTDSEVAAAISDLQTLIRNQANEIDSLIFLNAVSFACLAVLLICYIRMWKRTRPYF